MALEEVEPGAIQHVVVHLGTNDAMQNKEDTDNVKLNMAECLSKVEDTFPEAIVTVASIPPRKGKSPAIQKYNEQVASINTYLAKLAERSLDIDFLDNTHVYMNRNNNINKRHYSDSDTSGVHLSADGQRALTGSFLQHLRGTKPGGREGRKRGRSDGSNTPNSAEKLPKQQHKN